MRAACQSSRLPCQAARRRYRPPDAAPQIESRPKPACIILSHRRALLLATNEDPLFSYSKNSNSGLGHVTFEHGTLEKVSTFTGAIV